MEHIDLVEKLQLREKELMKELSAIQTLIGVYTNNDTVLMENQTPVVNSVGVPPKGNLGWENYAILVLRKVGGKAKAAKVTAAAIKANPDIDKSTVKSAIRAKLSTKYRDGFIEAIKGENKKDGYIYILDPNKSIRTK